MAAVIEWEVYKSPRLQVETETLQLEMFSTGEDHLHLTRDDSQREYTLPITQPTGDKEAFLAASKSLYMVMCKNINFYVILQQFLKKISFQQKPRRWTLDSRAQAF